MWWLKLLSYFPLFDSLLNSVLTVLATIKGQTLNIYSHPSCSCNCSSRICIWRSKRNGRLYICVGTWYFMKWYFLRHSGLCSSPVPCLIFCSERITNVLMFAGDAPSLPPGVTGKPVACRRSSVKSRPDTACLLGPSQRHTQAQHPKSQILLGEVLRHTQPLSLDPHGGWGLPAPVFCAINTNWWGCTFTTLSKIKQTPFMSASLSLYILQSAAI